MGSGLLGIWIQKIRNLATHCSVVEKISKAFQSKKSGSACVEYRFEKLKIQKILFLANMDEANADEAQADITSIGQARPVLLTVVVYGQDIHELSTLYHIMVRGK